MNNKNSDHTDSLSLISGGAGLFILGKIFSRGVDFITNVLLTRFLGASIYGIYSYINVVLSLFIILTKLGGDNSVMRFVPEYESQPRKRQGILILAYGSSLLLSIITAFILYLLAPLISSYTLDNVLFIRVLRITAIVIPFNTLSTLTFAIFKSIERMDYNIISSLVTQPLLRLFFVGGAVVAGYSLIGAAAGIIVTGLFTTIVAFIILFRRTDLNPFGKPRFTEAKEYYNFSIPLTFNQVGYFLYNRIDVLMIGFFFSGSEVGIYRISVAVAGFLSLSLAAFNQLFPPIASRLYHNNQHNELEAIYQTVTRIIFTISLFPAITAVLYTPEILLIFGEEFTRGVPVLILLTFAQLTNCLVGPSGFLLMMSDHQYVSLANQVGSGILNAVLNYIFIITFGFVGAALATAIVVVLINLLRVAQVWYFEGFYPYDRSYLKPVAAGGISAMILYGCSLIFQQYVLLIIGGATGAIAFFGVLYLLGIEQEVELLRDVLE
jgi:O-antigen/teichoic acid export membrane protein